MPPRNAAARDAGRDRGGWAGPLDPEDHGHAHAEMRMLWLSLRLRPPASRETY
jgi:hypothetical protein